jgi:hypothetical protein
VSDAYGHGAARVVSCPLAACAVAAPAAAHRRFEAADHFARELRIRDVVDRQVRSTPRKFSATSAFAHGSSFPATAARVWFGRWSEGRNMQKSAIEEIKELKAQLESKTEQAKTQTLDRANEAIGFLRELGIDNDTILKELGFRGRAKDRGSREATPPKEEPCPICNFRTDPPHDGRSHRGQAKTRPLTAEELEKKGLTKV